MHGRLWHIHGCLGRKALFPALGATHDAKMHHNEGATSAAPQLLQAMKSSSSVNLDGQMWLLAPGTCKGACGIRTGGGIWGGILS